MKPEQAPKPGTRVTIELVGWLPGWPNKVYEATVEDEPYVHGYDLPSGAWSLYSIEDESEPCYYLPLRFKRKKIPRAIKMSAIASIKEGWNLK